MHVVNSNCAGIDIHKRDVKVCLVTRDTKGYRHQEVRTYATTTAHLLAMLDWLIAAGCTHVAMESTGVYWKPIFSLLEGNLEILLVNPTHIKQVPGRKTDVRDCEWIAELLEHGLLQASFIPPVEIRDLRDLTRYRRKLVEARAAEVNRVQKILELANIKLASVATDVLGVSGRAILAALIGGDKDLEQMAELAKGRLRRKKAELAVALEGRFRPHHARLLARLLAHIDFLDESIAECEQEIEQMCRPFAEIIVRLDEITGVDRRAAQDIIAETGVEMSHFPSHKHLCSWAGISPGNNQSGGKRKSGRTKPGNKWLRAVLVECAQAAGHSKSSYLGAQFRRFASRKGKKRAAVVVAHSILEAAYFIMRDGVRYRDLGANYFDEVKKDHLIRYHVRRLESLGLKVELGGLRAVA